MDLEPSHSNVAVTSDFDRVVAARKASGDVLAFSEAIGAVAVVCCSDPRVLPQQILRAAPGSLFSVRVAGNSAGSMVIASLNLAVAKLAPRVVFVMGHTDCAAVALAGSESPSEFSAVVEPVIATVGHHGFDSGADELARLHVARTVQRLRSSTGSLGDAYSVGRTEIQGLMYDVVLDELELVGADDA